jgi:hypothetical protein
MGREKGPPQSTVGAGIPEEVLAVMQGGIIRAFVCGTDREQEVREMLASHWFQYRGYEVNRISPQSISREQIIQPGDDKVK